MEVAHRSSDGQDGFTPHDLHCGLEKVGNPSSRLYGHETIPCSNPTSNNVLLHRMVKQQHKLLLQIYGLSLCRKYVLLYNVEHRYETSSSSKCTNNTHPQAFVRAEKSTDCRSRLTHDVPQKNCSPALLTFNTM